jgi:hypothetical protein
MGAGSWDETINILAVAKGTTQTCEKPFQVRHRGRCAVELVAVMKPSAALTCPHEWKMIDVDQGRPELT